MCHADTHNPPLPSPYSHHVCYAYSLVRGEGARDAPLRMSAGKAKYIVESTGLFFHLMSPKVGGRGGGFGQSVVYLAIVFDLALIFFSQTRKQQLENTIVNILEHTSRVSKLLYLHIKY